MVITRFAPSPTGMLHIGGARTALFNFLFAKHNGGKFLLRVEDTDKNRSTDEAKQCIINGLNWLEINHDEEIIFQSQNHRNHQQAVEKLLLSGQAYYCYTTAEELQEFRKNNPFKKFKSCWRDGNKKPPENSTPVVRFKIPQNLEIVINDLIQGEVKVKSEEIDDVILIKNDGSATFNLACVVDDISMKITHVIRGDDHLTNSFTQKLLYEALEEKEPKFAHIPLIYGNDGGKMSKRHGATSVEEYQKMGYLPEAIRNYLLRLGWSHGNEEIICDEDAIKWFNLEKIGKSPARFDFDKLNNTNKHYLKNKNNEELFDLMAFDNILQKSKDNILKALEICKQKHENLHDLASEVEIYQEKFIKEITEEDLIKLEANKEIVAKILQKLVIIENWQIDEIKSIVNGFLKDNDLKMKNIGPYLRILLTFSSSSAGGIFQIFEILGKEEVIKRLYPKHFKT
jgi:glutamyl-tRNA synthetase